MTARGPVAVQRLDSWLVSPTCSALAGGTSVSSGEVAFAGWYPTRTPTTLLRTLVANKEVPDPRHGENFLALPGVPDTQILDQFALKPMPPDSPFRAARWWVTSFDPPYRERADAHDRRPPGCVVILEGINYRANLWVNGRLVADSRRLIGTYRRFEIDISDYVVDGGNFLALEIFPPGPHDLAFSFVDWHPMPPDKCTGIWRPARLLWFDDLRICDIAVVTRLSEDLEEAAVTVEVEVENVSDAAVFVDCEVSCDFFHAESTVRIVPRSRETITYSPDNNPQLTVSSPPLWWPYQLGDQPMVELSATISVGSTIKDTEIVEFGFREIASYLTPEDRRQFRVNGQAFMVRGAAWAPDMLLSESARKDTIDMAYLKDMGLNALRFEGNFGSDNLWHLCDREGILVVAGWTCDSQWEEYDGWTELSTEMARESLRSVLRRFRNHPSFAAWLYGSDLLAPPAVEKMYLEVLSREAPTLVSLASAGDYDSSVSGKTGVKMTGPYSYVPPVYWYLEEMPGVATGFNTETGPDVSIPPYESLTRMFSSEQLQPGSAAWCLHSGLRQFRGTAATETAVAARYGEPDSMESLASLSQVLSYEAWRAMFEACARFRPACTGVIGWMLTNAWPSVIWHLYDSLLYPTGGYFGTKKACSPLHVVLDYRDHSVWGINNTAVDHPGCAIEITLASIDSNGVPAEVWKHVFRRALPGNSSVAVGTVPARNDLSPVYFVFCRLTDDTGVMHSNTYWLSTTPDILSDHHVQFGTTEVAQHGDFRALRGLSPVTLHTQCVREEDGVFRFLLTNPGPGIAFFVEASIRSDSTRYTIRPVLWSDNQIVMRPDETAELIARALFPDDCGDALYGEVRGWNVPRQRLPIE